MIRRLFQLFVYILILIVVLGIGIWIGRSGTKTLISEKASVVNIGENIKDFSIKNKSSTRGLFQEPLPGQDKKDEGSKLTGSESKGNGTPTKIPLINSIHFAKVIRVIDGDTIEIEGGERVRYLGMDTFEIADPRKSVQCFGIEASNKNKELVHGKTVRLEKDITDRDKYNRLLRYVWVDDTFVNLELIKQGFAQSYSYPPDIKYQDQFVAAQKEAQKAKSGLWNVCPAGAGLTTVPSLGSTESTTSSSCIIKGNISLSGEKIYHLPGCGSYTKTEIEEARGEHWFCSEDEAKALGWRKALNCP